MSDQKYRNEFEEKRNVMTACMNTCDFGQAQDEDSKPAICCVFFIVYFFLFLIKIDGIKRIL